MLGLCLPPNATGRNKQNIQGDITMADQSEVLTVPEAGAILGLGRYSAYRAAKRGDIPVVRIGKLLKVPRHALDALLQKTAT